MITTHVLFTDNFCQVTLRSPCLPGEGINLRDALESFICGWPEIFSLEELIFLGLCQDYLSFWGFVVVIIAIAVLFVLSNLPLPSLS